MTRLPIGADAALVVIDVQEGFDEPWWGPRDNPDCDEHVAALVGAFAASGRPLVYVQHSSLSPESPLFPGQPGHALKDYLEGFEPALLVTKQVNSAFHGSPDLDAWLRGEGIGEIVVCGITINHCCETTARVGGNLGYAVTFVLDATHTFDRTGPDGTTMSAAELARATATSLHGEFATVLSTAEVLDALAGGLPA
ncbi:nicotinamidase-related amidase [Nocardioides marinisabuli]|uniref:Nicotinamidase-related amidase n=1 Tax=Nocardioides marinisabuli TaxID=419476 RepID=A0A7Y9JQT6_9ACTN|nr:cysteine hydrolase family protein [Nocardioides marinisabuli]NYD57760.1 nicotinamidase-related amidase [Nocardioides marinisabuli]